MTAEFVRLTTAQAIIRYLENQFIEIDGQELRVEQGMGFAAAGYAKQWLRQRFMFCTASAGPGTANLLTSAALAHANRLPVLMLCGDTFLTRLPDPVLQQLEHFGDPSFGLNDAFKTVSRYWDRITHPAQIIQSLPAALATLLDPADCGPALLRRITFRSSRLSQGAPTFLPRIASILGLSVSLAPTARTPSQNRRM